MHGLPLVFCERGSEHKSCIRKQGEARVKTWCARSANTRWEVEEYGDPSSALRLRFAGRESASAPVTVEFVQPPSDQAAEATRLRRPGRTSFDSGSWVPFLLDNWTTVELAPCLGAMARRQLALHLFLHRSIYSSTATALLDASSLRTLGGRILGPEAGALEYEILHARGDFHARDALGGTILKEWSGMAQRLEGARNGRGTIATGRRWWGAESPKARAVGTRAVISFAEEFNVKWFEP